MAFMVLLLAGWLLWCFYLLAESNETINHYHSIDQGFPNWDTCTPGVHFDFLRGTLCVIEYSYLIIVL